MERSMQLTIRWRTRLLALPLWAFSIATPALAQAPAGGVSTQELAKANNPLADANALNFQNYFFPSLQGAPGTSANALLLRPVIVSGRQIIRATLPVQTSPTGLTSYESGLGDFFVVRRHPHHAA